ncbi:MAG: hypothetical protein JXI32_08800 [Deltaproteobacteria bacterium]|nr:hypothetical protein [Deltaproteobacteria bacterium]
MKASDQQSVEFRILTAEFSLYSNPIILMMHFKGGKRVEAAQWSLEIQKMLRGIYESFNMLEGVMNQAKQKKNIVIGGEQIDMSSEQLYWMMIYLVDNAILRIYACLDKIAQMVRCFLEHDDNGGPLEVISRCGCRELMTENNCSFGSLMNYLRGQDGRSLEVVQALKELDSHKSIQELRTYRNSFTHRQHSIDATMGLDPKVKVTYNQQNGSVSTMYSFGGALPTVNWFRVEIVAANNAIAECVDKIGRIIFPRDFEIKNKEPVT